MCRRDRRIISYHHSISASVVSGRRFGELEVQLTDEEREALPSVILFSASEYGINKLELLWGDGDL